MKRTSLAALATLLVGCAEPPLLGAGDVGPAARSATSRYIYGDAPSQFVEHWPALDPAEGGPTVVLVHGGCWQAEIAGLEIMNPMAAQLSADGYEVYNIEYRRLGEPGGGYPGTFQDVGAALDALRGREVDLHRLVVVGHSAGGHLALWASARPGLPSASALKAANPLPIRAVLSLGGVGDLQDAAADATFSGACGRDTIDRLVDTGARGSDAFADTSPVHLVAPGVRQIMLHGAREQITPADLGHRYKARSAGLGQAVEVVVVEGAGHFEVIAPQSAAWPAVAQWIETLSR